MTPSDDGGTGPASPEARSKEPRRFRGRRALRTALQLVVALGLLGLVVLVLAFTFLHTRPGRGAARVFLEVWGSGLAGGTLRIGGLDYALWRRDAVLTDVSLELTGLTIDARRLELQWPPEGGPRVRVVEPLIRYRDRGLPKSEVPAVGIAAQPWRALERLGAAEVVAGRVELRDVNDVPWLVLGRLDARMTAERGRRVSVRAADVVVGTPAGEHLEPVSAEGTLALEGGRLVVERATLAADGSSVDLRAQLDRISPVDAQASAHAALDAALVQAFSREADVVGRVELDAVADVKKDEVSARIGATSSALRVMGLGPWAASARGLLEGRRFVLEGLEARGFGGKLMANGPLALRADHPTDLRVTVEGIDVAELVAALAGTEVPVAARADAWVRWTTTGWDVDAGKGMGDVALSPAPRAARPGAAPGVPAEARGHVHIAGRSAELQDLSVAARGALLEADARISGGALSGSWNAAIPLASIDPLLADLGREPAVPEGYAGQLVAEGTLSGTPSSPQATAWVESRALRLHDRPLSVEADARYADGRLSLVPLTVRSGAGHATLTGSGPLRGGASSWELQGEAESFDLAPLLAGAGIDASMPASAEVRVEGTLLRVGRLEADLAGGRVSGSGSYDGSSAALQVRATASGLAWAQLPLLPESLRRLDGQLSVDLALEGTPARPAGEAHATLDDAQLDGSPLPALALAASADGRTIALQGRAGESTFLQGGGPLEGDWPVRLEVDTAGLPLQAILDAFPAARARQAAVAATGGLRLDLPLRAPAGFRYSADDLRLSGKVRRREWATEHFRLEGDREAVTLGGLRLTSTGATLSVEGRVPLSPSASYELVVDGKTDLELADALLSAGDRAAGTASLRLRVSGTGADPDVQGEAAIDGARGRFEGARWRDLRVRARFLGHDAEVQELSARVLGGTLSATGRVPLEAGGRGGPARLTFEATDVDLARLLDADLRLESNASFLVSIDGEIEAREPSLRAMRARGRLSKVESRSAEGGSMGIDAPIGWRIDGGRLEHDPLRLTGPNGTLEARVEARLAGASPGGTASLDGPFDLRFLSPFIPSATLSGPASVDLRASWGGERPRLDGVLRVDKGRLVLEDLAFSLSQLSGDLRFEGDRVKLQASGAAGGDGKLRASGGMTLGPAFFGPAEVTLEAERVPIAYPEGFRGRATGRLLLSGDPDNAYIVSGDVSLSQGYYTAEFDPGTQSIGRLDWQLAALRGGTIGEQLVLDVDIRLAGPVRIRNRRATLDVVGSLTASGTVAQPTATGQVTLREGGTLTLSRAEVRVTRGVVELNGYPGGTPELDLQGATRVGGVTVNVHARGRVDDLQLTLDSPDRPDLSQTDLVSLVLTGRTASAVASEGGVVVAEELASAMGGVLQKGVGNTLLIDVSPDRSLLADDTDPTQRFNVGHRLTENLTVMYSTALDGTEKRWILDFNPGGGRFRYRVIDEETEGLSFEVTDRSSFDLWSRGRRTAGRGGRRGGRLASLRFEGELPLPEPELRKAARLKVGGRSRRLQREEAADRVEALLASRGWPGASVEAEAARSADRSVVDLVLHVEAGPRVNFQWWGDPLGGKQRKAAQAAWLAYAAPDLAAAAVARAALVSLQTRGYHAARVTPEVTESDGSVQVRLAVEAGRRGGAVRVDIRGNEVLDDLTLLAALPKPGSREFFEALAGRSTALVNPLRLVYARAGYVDARVRAPQSEVDPATGALTVVFTVREGSVSPVTGIVLPEEVVAAGGQGPAIATKVGQPFDVTAYVADREAIAAFYRREGWPDARVVGFLDPGPEGVSVRFAARPGPRPHVGEVRVAREGRVQERLVRRAVTLEPGDLVRPRELAESRERLSELGIFRSVEVRPEARAGNPQLRDILVNVATRPDVTLEYGLRYSTEGSGGYSTAASAPAGGKLQVAGGVELANPLGMGWRVRGYTFLTTDRQTWGVNLDSASFLGLRLRTQVLVYDENDQDIQIAGIASRVRGTTLQQTRPLLRDVSERRWHDRLRLQYGYTYKDILYIENAATSPFLSGNRAFLSLSLIGDERDSLTDPRRGVFWTATTELAREFLGSDVNYHRYYGQAFLYLPLLGDRLVWAQGLRLGVVPGEDPQLLIENRFRAGGPTTVRGFEQNGLGPKTGAGDSLGGQAVAVVNQELRFPIWQRLHGGVFWDAGNVWLTSGEFDLRDLRQSVGAGLRFMFPFGPLRVEYAWMLRPRPGEAKGRLVFGLGHAF